MKVKIKAMPAAVIVLLMFVLFCTPVSASEPAARVQLNGQFLEFDDAAPMNVEGRVMVPLRSILEAVGAQVDYREESRYVIIRKDRIYAAFTVGQSEITVNDGSRNQVIEMDVVPFIDEKTERVYVSARFIGEVLGFSVGWDHEEKTAVIIDVSAVSGRASRDFSIMDMMADNGMRPGQTYETRYVSERVSDNGSFVNYQTVDMNINSLEEDAVIETSNVEIVTAKEGVEAGADEEYTSYISSRAIINGGLDEAYIYSSYINGEMQLGQDVWFQVDTSMVADIIGYDFRKKTSFSQRLSSTEAYSVLLDVLYPAGEENDEISVQTYRNLEFAYDVIENLVGDDLFYYEDRVYELQIDTKTMHNAVELAFSRNGLGWNASDPQLAEILDHIKNAEYEGKVSIEVDGDGDGEMSFYQMELIVSAADYFRHISGEGSPLSWMSSDIIEYGGDKHYEIVSRVDIRFSDEEVEAVLPEDASILDIRELD